MKILSTVKPELLEAVKGQFTKETKREIDTFLKVRFKSEYALRYMLGLSA